MNASRAAIVGWPVAHSRSPIIHGHWLRRHGIDGAYERWPVPPDKIDAFFAGFAGSGLIGCNVTLPHKQFAARQCAKLDVAAHAIGAVNTLWLDEEKRLIGANTDAHGFLASLDQDAPGWDVASPGSEKIAIVLGAGGAARAIVYALKRRAFTLIYLVNRNVERAQGLAAAFAPGVAVLAWPKKRTSAELAKALAKTSLLVNTTSLGMTGQPALDLRLLENLDGLSSSAAVSDIVYTPLETDLLRLAREKGHRTVDGLGMLLHQAAPGFAQWFGVLPAVTSELRQAVVRDLESSSVS